MGQLTNFIEKKVLDHILKVASYTPPATVYVGFSTTAPNPDGSNFTAPTYTGYARKACTFAAAGSRAIAQTGAISFDPCTGGSSTVPYFGIFDALTGGNLMAYGALAVQKVIVLNNTPSLASGQVSISLNAGVVFTALANSILDWLFRAQALAQPTHVKIGLSTTTPTDGGPNITEPSGNNYAQVTCDAWNAASGNPEGSGNTGTITMPTPSGSWGLCTYSVLYLDTTPALYGTITAQTPDNGDTVEWLAGQMTPSLQ